MLSGDAVVVSCNFALIKSETDGVQRRQKQMKAEDTKKLFRV